MFKIGITIGVNKYVRYPELKLNYAADDAEKMRDFLLKEEKFNHVFCCTDNSPQENYRPTYANIKDVLGLPEEYQEKFIEEGGGDFWFFFSGHGARKDDDQEDYLLPRDASKRDLSGTSVSVTYVRQQLRKAGADKIVVIIDACRENSFSQIGEPIQAQIREMEEILIYSCRPYEKSRELDKVQQEVFTYKLLEAFRKGYVTPQKLDEYLQLEVAKLSNQTPIIRYGSTEISNLILTPNSANEDDI
ncbi:MAG: caspase family protein [Trichodesmium sp. MO_231.B1]|nr:caspase family protein [Trichodesmium sp. MO_231.B1]